MRQFIFICCMTIGLMTMAGFSDPPKSFYGIRVNDVTGKDIQMQSFRGKKVMVIILAANKGDSVIARLRAFQNTYNSISVLGVLASDDGYDEKKEADANRLYRETQKMPMLLTKAVKTRKAAGPEQCELLQWLTRKEFNLHFDQDVRGGGHKFFIDEKGELYAVIGPEVSLSSPVIQKIVSKPIIGHK